MFHCLLCYMYIYMLNIKSTITTVFFDSIIIFFSKGSIFLYSQKRIVTILCYRNSILKKNSCPPPSTKTVTATSGFSNGAKGNKPSVFLKIIIELCSSCFSCDFKWKLIVRILLFLLENTQLHGVLVL